MVADDLLIVHMLMCHPIFVGRIKRINPDDTGLIEVGQALMDGGIDHCLRDADPPYVQSCCL